MEIFKSTSNKAYKSLHCLPAIQLTGTSSLAPPVFTTGETAHVQIGRCNRFYEKETVWV